MLKLFWHIVLGVFWALFWFVFWAILWGALAFEIISRNADLCEQARWRQFVMRGGELGNPGPIDETTNK